MDVLQFPKPPEPGPEEPEKLTKKWTIIVHYYVELPEDEDVDCVAYDIASAGNAVICGEFDVMDTKEGF